MPTVAARLRYRLRGETAALSLFSYHGVAPEPLPVDYASFLPLEVFRAQMERIARRYDVLPFDQALDRLWSGKLRFPAAVLTFDDGYRNNSAIAFPLLRGMGLPATLFVCTAPVAEGRMFWFARLHRAICLTRRREVEWRGERFDLTDRHSRAIVSKRWRTGLKQLPAAEIDAASDALCRLLEVEDAAADDPLFGVMDEVAVRALATDDLVTLGGHTRHHWILSRLCAAEQRSEIAGCADDLERWTGRRPRLFAYPNGQPADFTPESDSLLRELGFRAAVTTVEACCTATDQWWRLPRVPMSARRWERRVR